MTNPESPSKVSIIGNTANIAAYSDITTLNLEGYIYTLATSITSGGILISDVTNPANPQHVAQLAADVNATAYDVSL